MVSDPEVIRGYYEGNTRPYGWMFVRAWAVPIFFWTLLVTLMLGVMLCVNALVRQQWSNREKLSYPLTHLPLQFTRGGGDGLFAELFRNRLFWIGFAAAAFVDINNGLNLYYPFIRPLLTPGFGQSYLDLGSFFPDRPWRAIGWTPASWYPFMVGLGVTMPLDFLFSAWFFYLFWKLELVGVMALGWDNIPRFPYINDQAFGAYLSLLPSQPVAGATEGGKVLGRPTKLDDPGADLLPHGRPHRRHDRWIPVWADASRLAGGHSSASTCPVTGMPARVELGTRSTTCTSPATDAYWDLRPAVSSAPAPWPSSSPSGSTAPTAATRCRSRSRVPAWRSRRSSQRGSGCCWPAARWRCWCFWAMLHLMSPRAAAVRLLRGGSLQPVGHLINPPRPTATRRSVGLPSPRSCSMRCAFPWPFHPLGFAVTASWRSTLVWMPLFIAWLLKLVILRYGVGGFRRSLPFFYGLIRRAVRGRQLLEHLRDRRRRAHPVLAVAGSPIWDRVCLAVARRSRPRSQIGAPPRLGQLH